MAQQLLSVGLALSKQGLGIGKKRRQEIRDSGALFCKGWDQLPKQGLGVGKERWQEIRDSRTLFCMGWDQLQLRLQNGGKGHFLLFPQFLYIKEREGEEKGWVLGHSLILWLLPAGGGQRMFSGGVLRVWCLHRGWHGGPLGGPREVDILGGGVDWIFCWWLQICNLVKNFVKFL
jgi:hypothetical protein